MKSEKPGPRESANCAFGIGSDVNMCKWSNLNMSAFHWVSSSGIDSYWIGGPHIDANDKNKEGILRPSLIYYCILNSPPILPKYIFILLTSNFDILLHYNQYNQ